MFSFVRLQVLVLKKPEFKGKMVEMHMLKKEKHSEWLTEKLLAAVFVCLCAFISRVVLRCFGAQPSPPQAQLQPDSLNVM